jgi:hypothetical protein
MALKSTMLEQPTDIRRPPAVARCELEMPLSLSG